MPAIGNDRQREALAAEAAQELAKGPTASCVELTKILHAQQTLLVFFFLNSHYHDSWLSHPSLIVCFLLSFRGNKPNGRAAKGISEAFGGASSYNQSQEQRTHGTLHSIQSEGVKYQDQ